MLANKIVQNSSGLLCKNALQAKNCGVPVRNYLISTVPPRNRLSIGEKLMFSAMLAFSTFFTPIWILYHIPDYQKEDRHSYTGK